MRNAGHRLALLLGAVFILAAGLSPAFAQETEKKEVKKEVIVKVDEDGNVTINGEPAEEGEVVLPDGSRMVVDRRGGRVIVIEEDEDGSRVVRRRLQAPEWNDDEDFVIFDSDNDAEARVLRHRIRVPDVEKEVEVIMDRLADAPHGIMRWRGDDGERAFRMRAPAPMFMDHDFDFDFDFDFASPEVMKLETETHKLARKIREAEGAEKRELEQELSDKLNQIFDKKLESRRQRVEKLQKRLQEEQAELKEREGSRQEIINRRKDELLGDDKLEW